MDFIGDLLNQMSSAFNQETAIPKKEEISMDETLKWRALKNNQFASRSRTLQQQPATGSGGGSGAARSGLTNGRKSAGEASGGGGGSIASSSTPKRERRRTAGNSSNVAAVDDGSRSPAVLLGENGSLTPPEVDGEDEGENIEIEIAKDISGEELQEALGLSQLIEVESTDDFTAATMEVEAGGMCEESLQEDRKEDSSMLKKPYTGKQDEIEQEDCKPEEEMDTKSSLLEVPYCSSASVSPAMVLAQEKEPDSNRQLLKRDTDEPDIPIDTNDQLDTKASNTFDSATAVEAVAGSELTESASAELLPTQLRSKQEPVSDQTTGKDEEVDRGCGSSCNNRKGTAERVDTTELLPDLDEVSTMEDDEDDVLIINTDEMDEVVELAETSKEDEDEDDAMSESKMAFETNTDDRAKSPTTQVDDVVMEDPTYVPDENQPEPVVVVAIPTENVTEATEEKFNPKVVDADGKKQEDEKPKSDDQPPSGDCEEVKYAESLKTSICASPTKSDVQQSQADEKLKEKPDEATVVEDIKPAGNEKSYSDAGSANASTTEGSHDKQAKQVAGRTTRSKKVGTSVIGATTITSTITNAASPSTSSTAAAATLSQRRSQRFQKEVSVTSGDTLKANGDMGSEPSSSVVVKEEELDDAARMRRVSVAGTAEAKQKVGTLKSDRSLRSKQQGNVSTSPAQPTVMTRRASETVKTSTEDANDSLDVEPGTEKTVVGRRGRKRLSQDRSATSSVVLHEPAAVRTREKSARDDGAPKVESVEQRRTSRSGFPVEPGESDTGGKTVTAPIAQQDQEKSTPPQPQQQTPAPQRRGRKRKNPSTAEATPPTGTSAASSSGAANADKPPIHPYKRAARQSRDGSDGILASALARRDKVDSQGRLSRPIKLSAKILANEELRQGFEQHNNGRIIIGSEPSSVVATVAHEDDLPPLDRDRHAGEPEKQRKQGREVPESSVASSSTIGSSTEDVTLVSVTMPTSKPEPSGNTSKRVPQSVETERDAGPSVQPGRKPVELSSSDRMAASKARAKQAAKDKAPPCPDLNTFLQEVRSMRLGTYRSRPEDNRKLNRRQQKRIEKTKEKFMSGLGLGRPSAHQPRNHGANGDEFDVELSVGESESSGSETDFVPPQRIGTVGRPSVTLRLRKPETLLENPPRKASLGLTGNRLPPATVPSGASGLPKSAVRQLANQGSAHVRQVGKQQANGRATTNGVGKSRPGSSSATVILPAAMTTLGGRASSVSKSTTSLTKSIATSMLKDKETEQLKSSLQRLGCEITLIPTTGRVDARPIPSPAAVGRSRGTNANAWTVRRVKESSTTAVGQHQQQRSHSQQNVVTPPILPGTTSPSLQIVLGGAGAPPVRVASGLVASTRTDAPDASSPSAIDKLICHCRQKSDIFVAKTVGNGYCTAVDDIDGQQIGCCNELSNDLLNMLRPSARVSFQLLCNMHRKRLEDHGCCAICGWFCTQGNFAMCKNAHLFHPNCAEKYTLNTPYNPARPGDHAAPTLVLKCPHCSQECPNGEIEVNIQLTSPPVLLPSRKSMVKPAKMTVSKTSANNENGISGASSASDSFRTTVQSLVPSSVKNMLATDHSNKNGSSGASVPNATTSTAGRASLAKDVGSTSGGGNTGTKHRHTAKDFTNAVCVKKDDAQVSEIITSGFDIETRFREFHHGTCLHVVCSFGTPAMAYLVMCRARSVDYLNILDRELHTAVMRAVVGSKGDIVKLLLDSGADATLKGPYGMTVLHLAAKHGQHETVRTVLECARQRLTARALMAFVNAVDNGRWTALAWAAENGHKQTVEQLVSIGADVNVCDRLNNTSLHWASLSGCSDTLYRLMTKDCNPNLQNSNGETPLHIACRQGHAEICVVLLAMGASLNVRNTSNELPQDIIADPNSECANIIAANVKMRNLSNNLKETHIICNDITNGRERHPVQVVYYTRGANERQLTVPKIKYIQSNVQIDSRITIDPETRNMHVCSCVDSTCTSMDSECLCSERTWYTNDGRLMNDFNYLDPPIITECGDLCDCNVRSCRNRVVQHGLDVPLQLCYIPGKGWGVRAMVPIPKGSFLIEYVGAILSDEAANHIKDDSYLFDLGNGYCIDASVYGNVSRFFNHSCQPNVSPVSVYYDHKDQRHPRVALFACRDIGVQEEICFDYGEKFWAVKKGSLMCRCNTTECRYRQDG
uniref:Histone-lysine N-methyltransferase n=1 Tax=Anopheles epiroticus TaxID=199890 RepID=A0A182P5T6_9DIPT